MKEIVSMMDTFKLVSYEPPDNNGFWRAKFDGNFSGDHDPVVFTGIWNEAVSVSGGPITL